MKGRNINIRNRIITSLFFLLIGGIIFNTSVFLHTHRSACGEIVIHAHPFNKSAENESPKKQHKHNKLDLQLISSLDYYIFSQNDINIDCSTVSELEYLLEKDLFSKSKIYSSVTSRGPPHESTLV